jgi:Rap1a immunity proteins
MKAIMTGVLMAMAITTTGTADEIGPTNVFFTGNDLHEFCQRGDPFRLGYVAGLWDLTSHAAFVVDGFPISPDRNQVRDYAVKYSLTRLGSFCPPGHVTVPQAADVFCKYLRDAPEKRSNTAAILFGEAMTKVWPCKP